MKGAPKSPKQGSAMIRHILESSFWQPSSVAGQLEDLCRSPSEQTEKAMATLSNTLAWKLPWTEEPGRLQSMGSLRVGHDWATSLSLFTFMHWRRKWQPTPNILAWRIPGMGEPGGLLSMGSHRVGHDWSNLAAAAAAATESRSKWITAYYIRFKSNFGGKSHFHKHYTHIYLEHYFYSHNSNERLPRMSVLWSMKPRVLNVPGPLRSDGNWHSVLKRSMRQVGLLKNKFK